MMYAEIAGGHALVTLHGPCGHAARAMVDIADVEAVARFRWHLHSGGYAVANQPRASGRGQIYMHRLLVPDAPSVDHINGNKLDNRMANLRAATQSQNAANQRLRRSSATGFKGVSFIRRDRMFQAKITYRGHCMNLGYYLTAEAAHMAYADAASALFGEFANSGDGA